MHWPYVLAWSAQVAVAAVASRRMGDALGDTGTDMVEVRTKQVGAHTYLRADDPVLVHTASEKSEI